MKRRPTGFVATCQCGVSVGAMDFARTDKREAGQILGRWLENGCTISPKFEHNWSATIDACQCATQEAPNANQ